MADVLAKLDYILAELQAVRDEVAAALDGSSGPPRSSDVGAYERQGNGIPADGKEANDFAPEHLLDTHAAQERFGYPRDTIAKWCRTEGLGVRRGGRWWVSPRRLSRHLNGK